MRILGITIPEKKRLEIGLTTLYGVGRSRAQAILKEANVPFELKAKEASIEQENKVRSIIEGMTLEGDLKREVAGNIKRLKDIKAYRGVRHMRSLPVRGQRTKTNSRTTRPYRGRKTMGTGRKIAEKK
ncbi:MAG: 30S ribosomal protein S13 [Patescibacteria group bacterium]